MAGTASMTTLATLARTLTREREALLGTIAWLSEAALDQQGVVGVWSVKHVLAHLAAHEQRIVHTLPHLLARRATSRETGMADFADCATSDTPEARHEALSPTDQVLELERVRLDLMTWLWTLDDAVLTRAGPWRGWEGTLAEYLLAVVGGHEREHHAAIHAAIHQAGDPAEYWPGARLSRGLARTHAECA